MLYNNNNNNNHSCVVLNTNLKKKWNVKNKTKRENKREETWRLEKEETRGKKIV